MTLHLLPGRPDDDPPPATLWPLAAVLLRRRLTTPEAARFRALLREWRLWWRELGYAEGEELLERLSQRYERRMGSGSQLRWGRGGCPRRR